MTHPPTSPAMGMVMIHEKTSKPTRCQFTALKVPLQRPTPTVAPVMHIDVETGSEYWEKMRTVMAAPISMEEPRLGEWYVILLPITTTGQQLAMLSHSGGLNSPFMMLYPYVISPREMVAETTAICQRGTSAFSLAGKPDDQHAYMTAQGPTALPTSLAP